MERRREVRKKREHDAWVREKYSYNHDAAHEILGLSGKPLHHVISSWERDDKAWPTMPVESGRIGDREWRWSFNEHASRAQPAF